MREKVINQTSQTTECVKMNFARQSFDDAIVWLNIGLASELARVLFPWKDQGKFSHFQNSPLDGYTQSIAQPVATSENQGILTSTSGTGE